MYARELAAAVKAAQRAQAVHRKCRKTGFAVASKTSPIDKVTTADVEAEKAIAAVIHRRFPRHGIMGEEGKYARSDSPWLWIVDPLDGTNNFSRGIPHYSVSVACAKEGEVVAGCVLDSERGELFTATKGGGAFLDGKRIHVSDAGSLDGALLGTGFYYDRGSPIRRTLKAAERFFDRGIMCVRRFGSAALDLCYVACGRFDGFWEYRLAPWDFAAGFLIVEEAGGVATDMEGRRLLLSDSYVVASNGLVQGPMLDVLGKE